MTPGNAAFAEIVAELSRICAERKSGTLYITSQANRSAQIVVDKGSIVFLYYFNKRGQDALKLMPEIVSGRYRFQEGTVPAMRSELLLTEDILRYLSAAAGDGAVTEEEPKPAAEPPGGSAEVQAAGLTSQQRQILEEGLAIHIGPMASLICEDHLRDGIDPRSAVELLAAEIPAEGAASIFREEMQRRLSL